MQRGRFQTLVYTLLPPLFGLALLADGYRRGGLWRLLFRPFGAARVTDRLDRARGRWGTLGRLAYAWGYCWALLLYGAVAVALLAGLGYGAGYLATQFTAVAVEPRLAAGLGGLLGGVLVLGNAWSLLRGILTGDVALGGEWKHETAAAERAHRRAQRRDPPVDVGEQVSFPVTAVKSRESEVHGTVGSFRIFVDRDVPSSLETGDVVCVQITSYATNDAGLEVGGHARFVGRGRCD